MDFEWWRTNNTRNQKQIAKNTLTWKRRISLLHVFILLTTRFWFNGLQELIFWFVSFQVISVFIILVSCTYHRMVLRIGGAPLGFTACTKVQSCAVKVSLCSKKVVVSELLCCKTKPRSLRSDVECVGKYGGQSGQVDYFFAYGFLTQRCLMHCICLAHGTRNDNLKTWVVYKMRVLRPVVRGSTYHTTPKDPSNPRVTSWPIFYVFR